MMTSINNKLIAKLSLSFFLLLVVIGVAFTGLTVFITNKHFEEVTQRLNSQVAAHLISAPVGQLRQTPEPTPSATQPHR